MLDSELRRSDQAIHQHQSLERYVSDEKKSEMIKRISETVAEMEASPEPKESRVNEMIKALTG